MISTHEEKNVYESIEKKKKKKKQMASKGAKTKSLKRSKPHWLTKPRSKRSQPGRKKKELPVLRVMKSGSRKSKRSTRPRSTRPRSTRPSKVEHEADVVDELPRYRPSRKMNWGPEYESEYESSALMALRKKPVSKSRVSREATRSKSVARKSVARKSVARKSVASKTSRAVTRAKSKSGAKGRVGNSSRGPSRALTPPKRKKVASKRK